MDESLVTKLLNPDDPQDVLRAVELMQAIIALSKFNIDTITGDVAAGRTPKSLHASHIHLFRLYQSAFMPHVLFYNSQTMVKNVCFCIAKQQKLDGGQFGLFRWVMIVWRSCLASLGCRGQHNSAMNYSQALDRIGAAKDIDVVFKKHPELKSGS
ncbi:hypothetical protein BDR07DRAFT_1489423 [Suillus spraguei]|nr:hypothetical protein BDR07DRAFT_1489423 [Suillus spraguei]